MKYINFIIIYLTIIFSFAFLFKMGIQLSFDIDTGYLGPIALFHAMLIIAGLKGSNN
jgi:hypothetical protein